MALVTLLAGGGLMDPCFSVPKEAIERSWLLYFNTYLYDRGVISTENRNKMLRLINSRYYRIIPANDLAIS